MDKGTRDRALQCIPYGLYVVGSAKGRSVSTIVANWAMQVSFRPALVAISIEENSHMRERIESYGYFSVNMLPPRNLALARTFLKPKETESESVGGRQVIRSQHGTPFLRDAIAAIECKVIKQQTAGDHILFFGEVTDAVMDRDGKGGVLTLRQTGWRYYR